MQAVQQWACPLGSGEEVFESPRVLVRGQLWRGRGRLWRGRGQGAVQRWLWRLEREQTEGKVVVNMYVLW